MLTLTDRNGLKTKSFGSERNIAEQNKDGRMDIHWKTN
jgi:hypothetical protein